MSSERFSRLARELLRKGGTLESPGESGPIDCAPLIPAIEKRVAAEAIALGAPISPEEAAVVASSIAIGAVAALGRLTRGDAVPTLTASDLGHLEAIVMLSGRPALRYPNGHLESPEDLPDNETWRVLVGMARSKIEQASASVGQIALEPPGRPLEPIGTGWRLGGKKVVTNRHVAKHLAANSGTAPPSDWTLEPGVTAVIDFAAVHSAEAPRRARITRIAWCASKAEPDLAILEVNMATDAVLPAPLTLDWSPELLGDVVEQNGEMTFRGNKIYVVGHPYRCDSPEPVAKVFGQADGKKRCSPGYVTRLRSTRVAFDHDCSTLGGNSGSCVFSADNHHVIGVHFAGVDTDERGVGASNVAIALSMLAGSQVGTRLMAEIA